MAKRRLPSLLRVAAAAAGKQGATPPPASYPPHSFKLGVNRLPFASPPMWGSFDYKEHLVVATSWSQAFVIFEASLKGGLGMFCEAYFLFAVGLLGPIFQILYPSCYVNSSSCFQAALSITYLEIMGIILGMLVMGVLADRLGRLWGSRVTALFMLIGGVLVVVAFGPTITVQFAIFIIGLFIFSLGVGGEFPLASVSAAERAEAGIKRQRGRVMVLTFALQGWGCFINTAVFCILLVITETGACLLGSKSCSASGLEITWRVQYAVGVIFVAGMVYLRQVHLKESKAWLERHLALADSSRESTSWNWSHLMTKVYVSRLIGASLSWFLWDLAYYGTKLFQAVLLAVTLGPSATLLDLMKLALLNNFIGLVGCYAAVIVIDHPLVGRTRLQAIGFFMCAILFLLCGFLYNNLTQPNGIAGFQFLYLLSSFFGQFGANATTWLVPGELFPIDVRSECHAICAALGKMGALIATLIFSFGNEGGPVSAETIFIVSGYTCAVGWLVTAFLVPNTTLLDLSEVDRLWSCTMAGEAYDGPALYWENLSYAEIWLGLALTKPTHMISQE